MSVVKLNLEKTLQGGELQIKVKRVYNRYVHKDFYASGFLYHPPTQQILLYQTSQEKDNKSSPCRMVGGVGRKEEDGLKTFQRIIYESLNLKLTAKSILPVYDYFHNTHQKNHFVFYAKISRPRKFKPLGVEATFSWFTFKQTLKLNLTEETKQDIVVAERVIRAELQAQSTIPPNLQR